MALLAGGGVVVGLTMNHLVGRERPVPDAWAGAAGGPSFPSGHTIGAATFLLVLGYLLWVRRPTVPSLLGWGLTVATGVGLVALSRLYLGYHFVTDVVASMALALAVLGVVVVLDRRRAARAARAVTTADG